MRVNFWNLGDFATFVDFIVFADEFALFCEFFGVFATFAFKFADFSFIFCPFFVNFSLNSRFFKIFGFFAYYRRFRMTKFKLSTIFANCFGKLHLAMTKKSQIFSSNLADFPNLTAAEF